MNREGDILGELRSRRRESCTRRGIRILARYFDGVETNVITESLRDDKRPTSKLRIC